MKKCICCGAELPEEANICLKCGKPQVEPKPIGEIRRWKRSAFLLFLSVLALLFLALISSFHFPRTFSASGPEVVYSDRDGSYRIYLNWTYYDGVLGNSMNEMSSQLGAGEESAHPSILFVQDEKSGQNLRDEFLSKVLTVEVHAESPENAKKMGIFGPAENIDFPEAALAADVVYNSSCGTNHIIWSIEMKNGDRIILQQQYMVKTLSSAIYTAVDMEINTIEDLNKLISKIREEDSEKAVTIFLPAVIYEGNFEMSDRGLELVGTDENGQRTTFRGHLTFTSREIQIPTLKNIILEGEGGTGISASTALELYQCTIRNYEIGVQAQDGAWIGIHNCLLENNTIGFQFDSSSSSMVDDEYEENRFLNNGTAISLLRVPGTQTLKFPKTVFSGNEIDITNLPEYPLDMQGSVFK